MWVTPKMGWAVGRVLVNKRKDGRRELVRN